MEHLVRRIIPWVTGILLIACVSGGSVYYVLRGWGEEVKEKFDRQTAILQAKGRLAEAKNKRAEAKKQANDIHVRNETLLSEISDIEKAKEKARDNFKTLNEIAKKAGLPKESAAEAEDRTKTIRVGVSIFTGEEIYRQLEKYKIQMDDAEALITTIGEESKFFKGLVEKSRLRISTMDREITELDREIRKAEAGEVTLKTLGDFASVFDSPEDTGISGTIDTLRKRNKEVEIRIGGILGETTINSSDLDTEVKRVNRTSVSDRSITDDDLI